MAQLQRFMLSLLVVACACAALAASPFACSQSPAPAMPQGQEAQPAQQALANEKTGFGDNPEERRMAYSSFMIGVFREESQIEQALQEGKTPRSRMHFQFLGIREDEEQAMRAIIVDAERRLKESDDRFYASDKERRQNPSAENEERLRALIKELAGLREEILDQTIAKLRQELGADDFKKLDAYVYQILGYHPKPSQATAAKDQDSGQTAPSQVAPAGAVHP